MPRCLLFLLTAALAAAIAGALGCGAEAKNSLRWASQADAPSADPHAEAEPSADAAKHQLYDPLAGQVYDPLLRRNAKMELEPSLAVAWRALGPTVWEFRLRAGVRFHDRAPLTAEDVVFSLERAAGPNSGLRGLLAGIAAIEKAGDHAIRIVTRAPDPVLPDRLTGVGIMSKAWAERNGVQEAPGFRYDTFAARNANGTGPFMLTKRERGVETVLQRNPAWWGWGTPQGTGNLDEIVFRPMRSPAARLGALLSGDVDLVVDLARHDLDRVAQDPKFKIAQAPQIRSIFLGLDLGRSELRSANVVGKNPFADKRVRQAIQIAIDTQRLKQVVMGGFALPAGAIVPPGVRGYSAALDRPVTANTELARLLFKQAGYPAGFSLRLDCSNDRYLNDEQLCLAVAGMLGSAGLRVRIDAQPQARHFAKIRRRESDFFLLGWGVPTYDSQYVLEYLYAADGSWNVTGYSSARMDELLRKMAAELDPKKRAALMAEAWTLAKADMVYVPLHHQVIVWGMSKAIDMPITAHDAPGFRWAKLGRDPSATAR